MDETAPATLLAWLDHEIWIVTAQADSKRGGLIATHVSTASIVPEMPRMLVGITKHHHTWSLIEGSGKFALHLLHEGNLDWVWNFGLRTGRDHDKLFGLPVETSTLGNPVLRDTVGWLDCRVETSLDIGDRTVYLAEVNEGTIGDYIQPLTMRRLLELAPPEMLSKMKHQRHVDSGVDAAVIEAWRKENEQR